MPRKTPRSTKSDESTDAATPKALLSAVGRLHALSHDERDLELRKSSASCLKKLVLHDDGKDHRENPIKHTVSETEWAVGFLIDAPKTLLDLFWQTMLEMQSNGLEWCPGAVLEQRAGPKDGKELAFVLFSSAVNYYDAMDLYLEPALHKGEGPGHNPRLLTAKVRLPGSSENMCLLQRYDQVRQLGLFVNRGRQKLTEETLHEAHPGDRNFSRMESIVNNHAGIVSIKHLMKLTDQGHSGLVPALSFFPELITHGGKANRRALESSKSMGRRFRLMDVPFIGGPSGSTLCFILALEDTSKRGSPTGETWAGGTQKVYNYIPEGRPEGLVPCVADREALITLFIASLVAGGAHSLSECLMVAQSMGYHLETTRLDISHAIVGEQYPELLHHNSDEIKSNYLRARQGFFDSAAKDAAVRASLATSWSTATLNDHLASRSYVVGYGPSLADTDAFDKIALPDHLDAEKHPHLARWARHISFLKCQNNRHLSLHKRRTLQSSH